MLCRWSRPLVMRSFPLLLTAVAGVSAVFADVKPHAGMLRTPDVSATQIVFGYANDLWVVPREGGLATPLASPPGIESFPRFSPDGKSIAFMADYDGNMDLYTLPVTGGVPFRVTHHPAVELLCDWTSDNRLLFFSNFEAPMQRQTQLFTVSPEGGMPDRLPVPYGANGALSPDGQWLAYTPHTADNRTWKRYRGGMATDIWLFNLRDHTSKKITDWEGTDSQPMWHGDDIYYMSDEGPAHRLNIWVYHTKTGKREQITKFTEFDIKWPAIGPGPNGQGEIVLQNGPDLYLLDLGTRQSHVVEIMIPGDRPQLRPQRVAAEHFVQSWDLSPTGKRAVVQARGDIWTIPAHKGTPRNLTRTSGVAERDPAWSPDGKWIAYFSDESGEYELYIRPADVAASSQKEKADADEPGAPRKLSEHGPGYLYNPNWSPDSKYITYSDSAGNLFLRKLEGDETITIETDPWASRPQVNWSHDSKWIAYTRASDGGMPTIWLYQVEGGEKHQVTSDMFASSLPTFDRKGDYLFFATNRRFDDPHYGDVDGTWIYVDTEVLCLVPLRNDVALPWAPKSDEESVKPAKEEKEKKEAKEKKSEEKEKPDAEKGEEPSKEAGPSEEKPEPAEAQEGESKPAEEEKAEKKEEKKEESKALKIDLDGFEQRAMMLPIRAGEFRGLAVNDAGQVLYVRGRGRGAEGEPAIKLLDLTDDEKKEKTVLAGAGWLGMSADGKKLLVHKGGTTGVIDAKPDQKLDKPMSLDGMDVLIDPRAEWKQIFTDAWRIERDFFYVPNMHGVDWAKMRDNYGAMLADCASRDDVSAVIKELISELNVGHAYYWSGDVDRGPSVSVGLLGVDFALDSGAYRITRIYGGAPWDVDARGPLTHLGTPGDKDEKNGKSDKGGKDGKGEKKPERPHKGKKAEEPEQSEKPEKAAKSEDADKEKAADSADKAKSVPTVKEGDYLLAVNRVPLDATKDPWAAFQGLAGKTVILTVGAHPQMDSEAREVVVELSGSEADLRYRAWVEKNRAYVAEKSNGQVGYIHVPNTGTDGQSELFRQFFGQRDKKALIIDDRWNAGGQIPDRFIEMLNRPLYNYWARRHGHDGKTPTYSQQGPKCMLINGLAGSGGDAFPTYFRAAGLGKLIGMRTWGGLVGISGNPGLIDNASITVPTFGFYKLNGTWGVEGHGVDPDIQVIDDPAKMQDGKDPQLDVAIDQMLKELKERPPTPPVRPADPDRSGMGVLDKDK